MRAAIAAALLLFAAGCGSSKQPTTSSTAPTTTTTVIPTTSITRALSASREVWERELKANSPRGECQGADAFTPDCVIALEKFAATLEQLSKTVASSGGTFLDAGLKALEVRDAARKWNDQCVTQSPEVRSSRGCLQALLNANNGDDAVLAEVYAAQPAR